jgi:hypothetical protein
LNETNISFKRSQLVLLSSPVSSPFGSTEKIHPTLISGKFVLNHFQHLYASSMEPTVNIAPYVLFCVKSINVSLMYEQTDSIHLSPIKNSSHFKVSAFFLIASSVHFKLTGNLML